jgi:hypothetical protein
MLYIFIINNLYLIYFLLFFNLNIFHKKIKVFGYMIEHYILMFSIIVTVTAF